jgi:hypothetical protein
MPQAKSLNCPSCGGKLDVANWFVRMVVCHYCGSTVAIENERLELLGKGAALVQSPTQFAVGRAGRLRGQPFRILGRVRYEADDGYWDEWYLELGDGSTALLEEEEGEYTLSQKRSLTSAVPPFEQMYVGTTLSISGQSFFVTERCSARVAGAEGQLPYRVRPGQAVRFVDGNIGGQVAALEYADDAIEYSVGSPLGRDEIDVEQD